MKNINKGFLYGQSLFESGYAASAIKIFEPNVTTNVITIVFLNELINIPLIEE